MSQPGAGPPKFYLKGAERGLVKRMSAATGQGPTDVEEPDNRTGGITFKVWDKRL